MKQVLQDLKGGELLLVEVPAPAAKRGQLLIRTTHSLISAGTERMLTDFARANYIDKARQQPEKVRQALDKARTDGVVATLEAVRAKLEQPMPMGYCNVGRVLAVGEGVTGFAIGDRVASNGPHAEVVAVPVNLCARIPDGVSDDAAAFTVISSIALQGIRLLAPTIGETVAVFGLGLIGLVAVQLLRANGARVLGFDFDTRRVELARRFGAEAVDLSTGADPIRAGIEFSSGAGVDGVLVTASTKSHDLMHQAAEMSRQRGRIVLTGVVGLNLSRADFYEKELTFQVSCSYGPGRYDPAYEEEGQDYPLGFVRWTEQRNFAAILDLMRDGRLDVAPLITTRAPIGNAKTAYAALGDKGAIGIVLDYGDGADDGEAEQARLGAHTIRIGGSAPAPAGGGTARLGLIGAGAFTQLKILPALKKAGAQLEMIASAQGLSATVAARKFGVAVSTTRHREILDNPAIDAVVVTTPHSSHARLAIEALDADKHVFVEKPLCMLPEELDPIVEAYRRATERRGREPILMVGFNRRFSPLTGILRDRLAGRQQPASAAFTCNAGEIPADHWVHDPAVGGGRIVGEACHFIDYLVYLTGSPVVSVMAVKQQVEGRDLEDNVAVGLGFADGSLGQVNYFARGSKAFPKERCEVFYDGRVLALDNFKAVRGYGVPGFKRKALWGQDKGHDAEFAAFVAAVRAGGPSPIDFASTVNVTRATFAAVEAMRSGCRIAVEG